MVWKGLFKSVAGIFGESIMDDIQEKVDTTLDNAKLKIEIIVEQVLKKLSLFIIVMIGVIFGLTGLAKYLTAKVPSFANGIGYVIVGLFLLLLARFVSYMSKK